MSDFIENYVWKILSGIHTSMPGTIVEYDANQQMATIEPGLMRKFKSQEEPVKYPLIHNVPVIVPTFGNAGLRPPKSSFLDSPALLLFSERSIEDFLDKGKASLPTSYRKFSLSDAVAICGIATKTQSIASNAADDSLEVFHGKAFIEITKDGRFKIKNEKSDLIKDILSVLVDTLLSSKVITSDGDKPFSPETITKFKSLSAKLSEFTKD